jgi:Right handed beta helix region
LCLNHIGRINVDNLDHGIYLERSLDFTIINNIFYDMFRGWGIQLDAASNTRIANNTFAFPNPYQAGQIVLWNGVSGVQILNNIFYLPEGLALEFPSCHTYLPDGDEA